MATYSSAPIHIAIYYGKIYDRNTTIIGPTINRITRVRIRCNTNFRKEYYNDHIYLAGLPTLNLP